MRAKRFFITGLAAAALVLAAGCKTTATTTASTDTTQATTSSTSTTVDNGAAGTMTSSTTTTPATTSTTYNNNGTTTTTLATTNPVDNTTTTTLPNGTTVSRSETTTIVYPNGQVQTINGTPSSSTMTSASGTDTTQTTTTTVPANLPPGAIVTKTTTTIKTTTAQPAVVATTAAQPATVYVNNPPPMTSSTTIYQPYRSGRGRRFPGTNFLVFGDRASFSNSNSALSGTLTSGNLRSDINHETGYGLGFNTYLGRSNFSTEFTASRIRPRATFTPSNTSFNPITGLRVRMTPITGALQLHMNPRSSVDFYIGGGGAYVMFRPDNNFNAGNTGITSIHFKDEWGPMVNAGLGFMFSPNFGLNFDAKYMWIRANTTTTFNSVTLGNVGNSERFGLNPFLLSAGLRFGF